MAVGICSNIESVSTVANRDFYRFSRIHKGIENSVNRSSAYGRISTVDAVAYHFSRRMVSHFVRNDVTDICRIAVLFPQFLQKTVRTASARCYGRVIFCALVDFYAGVYVPIFQASGFFPKDQSADLGEKLEDLTD